MILEVEAFRQGVSRLEREREAVPPFCGLSSFIKNSFGLCSQYILLCEMCLADTFHKCGIL